MRPPYRRFFPVILLIISISACAYLKRGFKKAEPETPETAVEEARETYVDESKPSLGPSGYSPDEKPSSLSKGYGGESGLISQDEVKSLKEKMAEMDQKLEKLYSLYVKDEQALKVLEDQLQKDKKHTDQLEERLLLLPRQIRELDEKHTRRINLQLSSDTFEENAIYESAQRLYRSGNYVDSVIMFKKYIASFPQSTLSDNAQYWIGEGYYSQRDYSRAIEELDKVGIFPDNSKMPDALLRKGHCYLKLNKYAEAKKVFTQIIDKYSANQTEYAIVDSARRKLSEIKGK